MKKTITIVSILLLSSISLFAQGTIVGKWKTIDDETGKPKSVVNIYEENGKYFGKVIEIFNEPQDKVCTECKGDKKGKQIVGMVIINDLEKEEEEYKGGEILDPANGKVYDCKLWVENGKLMVRGYLGFFFRTQEWVKAQ